jgi:uncharacterized protein
VNDRSPAPALLLLGLLLATGVALGGWFVGRGLFRARATERAVTVRGFSEREVPADLVLWPVTFTVTADDLAALQERADQAAARIVAFLRGTFEPGEYTVAAPRIQDRQAEGMFGQEGQRLDRYVAEGTVAVRTGKIGDARAMMARTTELVKQGIPIVRRYDQSTQYLFTGLERIKPEMIAEATKDARRAAERFAADSGAHVGGIRTAQQGLFTIEDRDPFSPEVKRIRVVTTVQYALEEDGP